MNQTADETARFVAGLARVTHADVQRFVIPPFTSLAGVVGLAHSANIWIGAQNLHWAPSGEYTGEISGRMLQALDLDLVLVGHAERRQTFGENDTTVRRKLEAALACGLRVLLCVGETADERRRGAEIDTVMRQVRLALHGIADRSRLMVAYEPIWAIGAGGEIASPDALRAVTDALQAWLSPTPLLYGGSVDASTAGQYAKIPGIDGLFVGRAAWTPESFEQVLKAAIP